MVGGIMLRSMLLALVPILWFSDALRIGHLYVISCASGAITTVTAIAARAYLPWLLPPHQLVRANSRIEVSASVAQFAGPGFGGLLVAWLTAPLALALDAIGLLGGAYCLASIRRKEPVPEPPTDRPYSVSFSWPRAPGRCWVHPWRRVSPRGSGPDVRSCCRRS